YTLIGDLNLDKQVSISDFIELASDSGQAGNWRQGDGNYDQNITIADFIDLSSNFGQALAASSLEILPQPEAPESLVEAVATARPSDSVILTLSPQEKPLELHHRPLKHQPHHRRRVHKAVEAR